MSKNGTFFSLHKWHEQNRKATEKTIVLSEKKQVFVSELKIISVVLKILFIFLLSLLIMQQNVEAKEQDQLTIYISLWENQLYVLQGEEVIEQYPIAPGKDRTPTPVGRYYRHFYCCFYLHEK